MYCIFSGKGNAVPLPDFSVVLAGKTANKYIVELAVKHPAVYEEYLKGTSLSKNPVVNSA